MDRSTYIDQLHARFGVAEAVVVSLVEGVTDRTVTSTRRVISGDENEVHRIGLADGSTVYLRVSFPGTPPGKLHYEAWAMGLARDAGVPVPEVAVVTSIESDEGERTAMVVRAAPGRQLQQVLPSLSPVRRSAALADVGRVLAVLHSIPMPGAGVPDEHGVWNDPDTDRRRYLADVLDDCQHLAAAGLTPAEVDRVVEALESPVDVAVDRSPVLCHGDVSPEHVFVDAELRMVGLIDWGLWHAGSAVSELAGVAMTTTRADFDAISGGHRNLPTAPALQQAISWHTIAQTTGQIRWLVTSGQTHELEPPAVALRNALAAIAR